VKSDVKLLLVSENCQDEECMGNHMNLRECDSVVDGR
jgi:hypothetical protein